MSRSLTYAELGALLGITPASANKLARRKHWLRTKGNDGKTRVSVPDEGLATPDTSPDCPPDCPGDSPGLNAGDELQTKMAVLEAELSAERRRADTAEADRDAWRDQAQRLALSASQARWKLFGRR